MLKVWDIVLGNSEFSTGLDNKAFHHWQEAKCHSVGLLFNEDDVIPYDQLRRILDLPEMEDSATYMSDTANPLFYVGRSKLHPDKV
ncbi:hypothetical protein NDU88_005953 [Pleurodeles waltl]|uniref:Uncharacterized protein n=1 Tax=Pleurodeles waltl TaxID=8319 RepID=A0AAV7VN93_PLEWA|nr:hypothetical protein NDU88_005953 [Pleurodeles waltl]